MLDEVYMMTPPKSLDAPNSSQLTGCIKHIKEISPTQRHQMYNLLACYFDNVTLSQFEHDLAEKEWGVLLTDAKYLEVGLSTKEDNIVYLLTEIVLPNGIPAQECAFWGDEFGYLAEGLKGSDAYMITEVSRDADFYDVSGSLLPLPQNVQPVPGGIQAFRRFLRDQALAAET